MSNRDSLISVKGKLKLNKKNSKNKKPKNTHVFERDKRFLRETAESFTIKVIHTIHTILVDRFVISTTKGLHNIYYRNKNRIKKIPFICLLKLE